MSIRSVAMFFAVVSGILACSVLTPAAPSPSPTPAPPPTSAPTTAPEASPSTAPTQAATATNAATTAAPATLPSGSGPCQASSVASVTMYGRPSLTADVFSTIPLTSPVEISSRTSDGWLGFEPGTAQAANMGVFRLRWLAPDATVSLSGNCAAVPVATWVPQPRICYEMVMEPVQTHASADALSTVTGTLNPGDFAAILGQTASGWLSVSGDQANKPGVNGYIPQAATNFNGPCDSIPTVPG
jgi:hypothetical protein